MEIKIETKNLYLVKPSFDFLNELYIIHSDIQTNLYNPNGPHTNIEQTRCMINDWMSHWEKFGFGYFLILNKNIKLVGSCGVKYKEIKDKTYLNLYYRINPKFMRQGYTKEACKSVIKYIEDNKINNNIRMVVRTKKEITHLYKQL